LFVPRSSAAYVGARFLRCPADLGWDVHRVARLAPGCALASSRSCRTGSSARSRRDAGAADKAVDRLESVNSVTPYRPVAGGSARQAKGPQCLEWKAPEADHFSFGLTVVHHGPQRNDCRIARHPHRRAQISPQNSSLCPLHGRGPQVSTAARVASTQCPCPFAEITPRWFARSLADVLPTTRP
jgi:hypothetical protein